MENRRYVTKGGMFQKSTISDRSMKQIVYVEMIITYFDAASRHVRVNQDFAL